MNDGAITGFLFADFTFANDDNLIKAGQECPFTLPADATGALDANAQPINFNVAGDLPRLQESSQGLPSDAALSHKVFAIAANGRAVKMPAGTSLEAAFTLRATFVGGAVVDLSFIATGSVETGGRLFVVVPTAPIPVGRPFSVSFLSDGDDAPCAGLPCLVEGALIDTPTGARRVEDLAVGDDVSLFGGGAAKIAWRGRRRISARDLALNPDFRPVRIAEGAFGLGAPSADLYVSPQHRLLLRGRNIELLFGDSEVFAAAQWLCDGRRVRVIEEGEGATEDGDVVYHQIMFDRHEVIHANGLPTESFNPGAEAIRALDPVARRELETLFPTLCSTCGFSETAGVA